MPGAGLVLLRLLLERYGDNALEVGQIERLVDIGEGSGLAPIS
jgi:hypothetical protein